MTTSILIKNNGPNFISVAATTNKYTEATGIKIHTRTIYDMASGTEITLTVHSSNSIDVTEI